MSELVHRHYNAAAELLAAEGWIVGRRTMAEVIGNGDALPLLDAPNPRPAHVVAREGRDLAVGLDPSGRLGWSAGEVDGDQAVAVLSERVPDATLDRLCEAGVSYVFGGPDGRSLDVALSAIGEAFAVRHLILEGGGAVNGAFLAAGLIDEVSTLICPAIDGLAGIPAIFEHAGEPDSRPAAGQHLRLVASETLPGGVVWLRHAVVRD